jgi:cell pole-organizing protein PopZ
MEEALTAIRRAIDEEEVGKTTLLAPAGRPTSGEGAKTRPEAELLSSETTAAIGSAINTLRETVKKQEPTVEEVVREALRPLPVTRPSRSSATRSIDNSLGEISLH